jgi:preprotein translocase subunit SecA
LSWLEHAVEAVVGLYTVESYNDDWDMEGLETALRALYPIGIDLKEHQSKGISQGDLVELIHQDAVRVYQEREEEFSAKSMRELERFVLLSSLDRHWQEHLDNMDYLRDGIGLRSLAQIDPINAYRSEGFVMFEQMQENIQSSVVTTLFKIEPAPAETIATEPERKLQYNDPEQELATSHILEKPADEVSPIVQRRVEKKIGRNEICPFCNSGKKYKHCHGK